MKLKVLVLSVLVGVMWVSVTPAEAAKWTLGDGPTDLAISQPPNTAPGSVCTTRIHGLAGINTSVNPHKVPPPPPPYSPITLDVYTAPDLTGATVQGGDLFTADHQPVPLLKSVTTTAPTPLKPPEKYENLGGTPLWEYAAAPFQIAFAAGKIPAGNDVVVLQSGYTAYVRLSAVACSLTKWRTLTWGVVRQGDVSVSQTPSKVSVAIGTAGTSDPLAADYTDCTLSGNFNARVHYSLDTWPAANGVRVGLLVDRVLGDNGLFGDGAVTTERTSFAASGDVGSGENYVLNGLDSGGGFLTLPTSATSGSLRVRRQGDTLTSYYQDASTAGRWAELGTSPAYAGPVTLAIQVWPGLSLFQGPAAASFSNFALTRGTCV